MRNTRQRFSGRVLGALLIASVLVLAACGSSGGSKSGSASTSDKPAIIVGSKDFAGAQIISQAYGQTLESKGYKITYKDNIGPTETVFPLLQKGDIDLYGEFSGTFLTFRGGTPTANGAEVFSAVRVVAAGGSLLAPLATSAVLRRVRGESPPTAPSLTMRERMVLEHLARGLGNKQIAARLGITERTVKFHVSSVFTKLGAANRTEAVTRAAQAGLIEL